MKLRSELLRTAQLAAPLVLGQLLAFSISFVDTMMAGRFDALTLAAVAIGSAVWQSMLLFVIGVMMAIPPFVSHLDGADHREKVGGLIQQASYIALALALLYILVLSNAELLLVTVGVEPSIVPLALGYLDGISWGVPALCGFLLLRMLSEGLSITRPIVYFGLLGLAVNIPANYLLIFGHFGAPRLGATGCGYASSIAQWLQFLGILGYVLRHHSFRSVQLFQQWTAPDWRSIRGLLSLGLPIGGSIFVEGSLFSAAALLMGKLGPTVAAAHQVAINFTGLMFMLPLGIGMALTVRIGNALGRGDPAAARLVGLIGFAMVLCTQVTSAALMLLFPEVVAALYTDDPLVRDTVVSLLFLAAIFQLPDGLQAAGAGALRGLKDSRIPMLFTILAYWLVGLPLGYLLGLEMGYGAEGMWGGLIAGLTVAASLMISRFFRLSLSGAR
jgi:MATE family multidrug resistance protein